MLLVLTYRERQCHQEVSKILRCSVRKLYYTLPAARKHLAEILDRMDIL
jgi:DNA-directed RNA polymerase specialized sigma24 family protein